MDGSQFCCCGLRHTNSELNDESRFAETHSHCSLFGKSLPLRISHTLWKRNSLACKPWRRKSLSEDILTRTCWQTLFWFKMLILWTSVFQGVLNVWQWTTSAKSRVLLVILIGGLHLQLASCQESLQPSLSDRHQLLDQVVYVGSMFSYTIFEGAFDCKVDTLVVTEASDRFLSHWLAYNEKQKQLYGVPSHKDIGIYDILVVALAKDERVRGQVCGSKSFSIIILPLGEGLPISVYVVGGSHDNGQESVPNMLCTPGVQVVLGTVILDTHLQNLNGHERVTVLVKMAEHLKVHSNKVKLFSGEVSHPLIGQLDSPAVMAAGAGDGRFSKGPRTLFTWNIGCGAMKLEDDDLSNLEVTAQDGTITDLLGFPVVGWHIMSGSQKSVVKHHRIRRQVGVQATPTPTMSSLLPTQISTISTSVIVSKSVTLSHSIYSSSSRLSLFTSSMDVPSRTQNRSDIQSSSNVPRAVSSQIASSSVPSSPISTMIVSLTVNGSSPLQSANRTTATIITSAEGFTVKSTVLVSPSVTTSPSLSLTITPSLTTIFTSTFTSPSVSTTVFTTGSPLVSTPNSTVELVSSTDRLSSMNRTTTLFTPSGAISSVSNVTSAIPVTSINSSMVTMMTLSHLSPNTTVLVSSSSLPANQTVILSTSFTPTLLSSTTVFPSQNSSEGFPNSSVPQTSTFSMMSRNVSSTSNSSATSKKTGSFLSMTSLVSNVTILPTSRSINLSASLPQTTSQSSARLSSIPSNQSSSKTTITNSSISLGPSNSSASKRPFTSSLSSLNLVPSLSTSVLSSQSSFENSSTVMSSTLPVLNTTVVNTTSTISTSITRSMQQSLKITSSKVLESVSKSHSQEITSMKPSVSTQLPSASSLAVNSTSAPNSTSATVIYTKTVLQPSTQSTSIIVIVLSSLTSSPLVTSVNATSLVKSLNTSIAKSTVQVNSTSLVDKPSLLTVTTPAFSPTLTSGTRTFTTTPSTDRSVVATTQGSVGKSSTIVSSPSSPQTTVFTLSPDFTMTPNLTSTFLVRRTTPSFTSSTVNITRSIDSTVISPNLTAKSTIQVLNSTVSPATAGNLSSLITGQTSLSSSTTQAVLSSSTSSVSTGLVVNSTVVYYDTSQPEISGGTRTLFHSASFSSSTVLALTTPLRNTTMFFSPSRSSPFVTSRISPSSSVTFVENSTSRSSISFSSSGVSFSRSFSKSSSSLFGRSTVVASASSTSVLRNSTALTLSVAPSAMPSSPIPSTILTSNTPSSNTSTVPSETLFTPSLSSALFSSFLSLPGNSTDHANRTMGVVTSPVPSSPLLSTTSRSTSTESSTYQFTSSLSSALVSSPSSVVGNSTVPVSTTMTVVTSPMPRSPVVSTILTSKAPSRSTSAVPSMTQLTSSLSTTPVSSSLPVSGNSTVRTSSMFDAVTSKFMTSGNVTSSSTISTSPGSSMMNSTSMVVSRVTITVEPASATLPSRSRLFTVSGGVTVSPSSFTVNRSASSFSSLDVSGTLPSSFVFPSSNVTPTSAVTNTTKTIVPTTTAIPNYAPTVYNNIARLTALAGKALYYTIPEDTFYDKEDQANTRKLALTMSLADGTAIPPDFWLQFNNETQTIYGLPMNTHVPSGGSGIEFVMRARDSRGAVAYDAFEVLVISSESAVVQKLTVRFSSDFESFSANVSQRLLLLETIAEYYGDPDVSALRVSAITSGSVVMTWSNDTLPTDTCDEEKVRYVEDKIFLPSGEIREEFKVALEGFPPENGSHQLLGVCNDSAIIPPATFAPLKDSSSEGDLWFKFVLVGVIVVVLIIALACLLVWYLRRKRPKPLQPEKRTYRKRKPIVLDPEIEMKPISGKPVVLPDDDPSHPPSYLSETSLDKPWEVSDDEDEVDYGKRPPPAYREHSPQSYSEPRDSPPPGYMLPPMYAESYC